MVERLRRRARWCWRWRLAGWCFWSALGAAACASADRSVLLRPAERHRDKTDRLVPERHSIGPLWKQIWVTIYEAGAGFLIGA